MKKILLIFALLFLGLIQSNIISQDITLAGVSIIVSADTENNSVSAVQRFMERIIPTEWFPPPESQPLFEIRVQDISERIQTCEYNNGRTIRRIRLDMEITIFNLEIDEVIASHFFEGTSPSSCPNITDDFSIRYGEPNASQILLWLSDNLPELPPTLFTLTGHRSRVIDAFYTPDGNYIITVSNDDTVRIWNADTGEELHNFEVDERTVSISPDGHWLLLQSRGRIPWVIRNIETGERVTGAGQGQNNILSALFSPDGNNIIARVEDGITIWNITDDVSSPILLDIDGEFSSPINHWKDDLYIVVGESCEELVVFNIESIQETLNIDTVCFGSILVSPDGNFIINSQGRLTQLIDTSTWEVMWEFESNFFRDATFSPNELTFAIAHSNGVRIWDIASRQLLFESTPSDTEVYRNLCALPEGQNNGSIFCSWANSIAYSPDGNTLVAGDSEGFVRVWDISTGLILQEFRGSEESVSTVSFSPDGQSIVSTSDSRAIIWNISSIVEE